MPAPTQKTHLVRAAPFQRCAAAVAGNCGRVAAAAALEEGRDRFAVAQEVALPKAASDPKTMALHPLCYRSRLVSWGYWWWTSRGDSLRASTVWQCSPSPRCDWLASSCSPPRSPRSSSWS
eukprot:1194666-Prorocentrum_minimum.AAC.8